MNVTGRITPGVDELGLSMETQLFIHDYALNRFFLQKDTFNIFTPVGINVEISDGNDTIETKLISEVNISERLYCIVDDYGHKLVSTILLPNEY